MRLKIYGVMVIFMFVGLAVADYSAAADYDVGISLQLVKEKTAKAANLIESEGEAAFPELRNKQGEFWFDQGRGYVWVQDLSGNVLVHPAMPEIEGTNVLDRRDSQGFAFVKAIQALVKEHGSGWVVYFWPKPGKKLMDRKAAFVKLVCKENHSYVVSCGMYNADSEYVKSQCPHDLVVFNPAMNRH
ncbi:MAG: cache domain-containing protein [Candidatus Omnitrophica bacterium]|nr:cache domain-containing protein [Candidatus Omnitrophota bacterium]